MQLQSENKVDLLLSRIRQAEYELREIVVTNGKDLVVEMMKPMFEVSEQIKKVAWQQYTPYFNDGDPCTFGVYWDGAVFIEDQNGKGIDFDYQDFYDGFCTPWSLGYYRKHNPDVDMGLDLDHWTDSRLNELNATVAALCDPIGNYEDVLKMLFGDHVRVEVSRDGVVETFDYEHD